MELEGRVVSGIGRGASYIGMNTYQKRFKEVLGFSPYPGTLNIEVDEEDRAAFQDVAEGVEIDSFVVDGEQYSAVTAYPAEIDGVQVGVLDLEITDHPERIVEIIAPVNLRDELDLEDGDEVVCRT